MRVMQGQGRCRAAVAPSAKSHPPAPPPPPALSTAGGTLAFHCLPISDRPHSRAEGLWGAAELLEKWRGRPASRSWSGAQFLCGYQVCNRAVESMSLSPGEAGRSAPPPVAATSLLPPRLRSILAVSVPANEAGLVAHWPAVDRWSGEDGLQRLIELAGEGRASKLCLVLAELNTRVAGMIGWACAWLP